MLDISKRLLNCVELIGDYRDNYSPGWKFNHWELKGVPLRLEIGPRDVKQGEYVAVRRDTGEKLTKPRASAAQDLKKLLDEIHQSLLAKYFIFISRLIIE